MAEAMVWSQRFNIISCPNICIIICLELWPTYNYAIAISVFWNLIDPTHGLSKTSHHNRKHPSDAWNKNLSITYKKTFPTDVMLSFWAINHQAGYLLTISGHDDIQWNLRNAMNIIQLEDDEYRTSKLQISFQFSLNNIFIF